MRLRNRALFLALVFGILLASGCIRGNNESPPKSGLAPGDYEFELTHDGVSRFYLLHVPSSYDGKNSVPLVLAFHGGAGSAESMAANYGWKEKSDEEGFLVAFPNGASKLLTGKLATWNAGNCCGHAVTSQSDDVGFIARVVEDIQGKARVSNVFATGMSNGGMLSHRLACDLPNVFTAIGAVAGTLNYDACTPNAPISILHIHSLQDDHVLYEGGCGPSCNVGNETQFVSVADTISKWVKLNACDPSPSRVFENENAYCDEYSDCENGVRVKVCTTLDGGHSWPGVESVPNPLEKAAPSQALDATDELWDFFENS